MQKYSLQLYKKRAGLRRLANVFRWKFYNWIVCSLVPNRSPLTSETSVHTCFARPSEKGDGRVEVQKCERYLAVKTAVVGTDGKLGGAERKRARGAGGGRESRSRRWWRKPLIQIVRSAGPTSEASTASGERILEIQWPPGICMGDRYANHGNLLKKYGEISSN